MSVEGVYPTQAINTPTLITGIGSVITVLAANPNRIAFSVQNVGTAACTICIGGTASATVLHYALKGGSSNNDGTGGSITFNTGAVPTGIVTMYGTSSAIVTAMEIAPL